MVEDPTDPQQAILRVVNELTTRFDAILDRIEVEFDDRAGQAQVSPIEGKMIESQRLLRQQGDKLDDIVSRLERLEAARD